MHYIKVLATDSTNSELKRRLSRNPRMSNTSFFALHQKEGRGQRGTRWESKQHKNLTFSILLNNLHLKATENFKLNIIISCSLQEFLQNRSAEVDFHIKWPNDILAGRKKICGILIENVLLGKYINSTIIGIGLNANQTDFENLPQATSLKKITNITYNIEELWRELTEALKGNLDRYLEAPPDDLLQKYENGLFKKDINAKFEFPDGTIKDGRIKGVSPTGKLRILFTGGIQEFQLKEVKLLY